MKGTEATNAAWMLRRHALAQPDTPALIFLKKRPFGSPEWQVHTYWQLETQSDRYARYLRRADIGPGTRIIMMVKPGPTLLAILFAIYKVGAVPVVVDPGMGIKRLLHCFQSTGAEAFIGIPLAFMVRLMARNTFAAVRVSIVVVGDRLLGGGAPGMMEKGSFYVEPTRSDALSMINFTTGSTGPAKGVEYTQAMIVAMAEMMGDRFGIGPGTVELVTVPLFGLFDLMLGATAVLPEMNPTRPAHVDPRNIIDPIHRFGASIMFASPALLNRVAGYGLRHRVALSSLKVVNSGGAPVSMAIQEAFSALLPDDARFFIIWGATEGLPLSFMDSAEVLETTREMTAKGYGNCIGRPFDGVSVKVVAIGEEGMTRLSEDSACTIGAVGELIVSGANVSARYHQAEVFNHELKIPGPEGTLWHRTGDLGFLDALGRIWFCGRMAHRVKLPHLGTTLYSVQCEGVINAHPCVYRSALVGIRGDAGGAEPVMCVELTERGRKEPRDELEGELAALLRGCEATYPIETVLFHPAFPVDIRHNAKINREALSKWATIQKGGTMQQNKRNEMNIFMTIPVFGWLFILWGFLFPFEHTVLKALWWIDIFFSVGVHTLQILIAVPLARKVDIAAPKAALCTLAFGATWWHPIRRQVKKEAS